MVTVAATASAGTINTGLNLAGTLLPQGAVDFRYSIFGPGGLQNAVVATNPLPSGYYQAATNPVGNANASWITSSLGSSVPNGTFIFEIAQVAMSSTISGIWAADHCGSFSVSGGTVTGGSIGSPGQASCLDPANYSTPTPFTVTGLTIGNVYSFTFVVVGGGSLFAGAASGAADPTPNRVSLFVDSSGASSSTPEPSSIFGVATGLAVVACKLRRRYRSLKAHGRKNG